MIVPPKTLAAAAVRPRSMLVRIAFIGEQQDDSSVQINSPRRPEPRRPRRQGALSSPGVVESAAVAHVHDITILHDVVLTFQTERAFGARVGFRTRFEKLIPADGFGADEVLLQIGVDGPGGFLRAGMGGN